MKFWDLWGPTLVLTSLVSHLFYKDIIFKSDLRYLETMPPVFKQSRALKAKAGKKMHWTLSDATYWIRCPVIPEAEAGHIHIHRNKDADAVQVWMLGADGGEKGKHWVDISEEYSRNPLKAYPSVDGPGYAL